MYVQLFSGVSSLKCGEEKIHVIYFLLIAWPEKPAEFWLIYRKCIITSSVFCIFGFGTTFLPPVLFQVQDAALNVFCWIFLYCRGSCDFFPPVAFFCRGESIWTADPYSAKVDIDYNAESNPVDLVNTLQAVVGIDLFPHSTLTLLFPTSPEAMGL